MGTADHLLRYLPIELVSEILSWLPVTSICRFTCICKSWYALINNPDFITTHTCRRRQNHRRSNNNTPPALLLCCRCWGWVGNKGEDYDHSKLALYDLTTFRKHLAIEYPFRMRKFVGTCGGLICLTASTLDVPHDRQYGDDLYLWNPIINRLKTVPNSSSSIYTLTSYFLKLKVKTSRHIALGFGFHEQANDYKIIRIVYFSGRDDKVPPRPPAAEVYSLRTDSWTTVQANVPGYADGGTTRFVNGAIYWFGCKEVKFNPDQIVFMSFDFNQEVFQIIQLPPHCLLASLRMVPIVMKDGLINSELAIGTSDAEERRSWDIWMPIREEGGTSRWTWSKKFHIVLETPYLFPWGIKEDAKVLFSFIDGDLFSLDVENQQCEAIGVDVQHSWSDLAFMESLALLDQGPSSLAASSLPW